MKFDCIIVLANEMDPQGNLNPESLARIERGVELWKDNPSARMITCGWAYRKDSDLCIGNVLKDYAIKMGVPAEKIIPELNSRDTVGDAVFTKLLIVNSTKWRKIQVVTSDYHVNRTAHIFRFIYGPEYEIEVAGSGQFDGPEKQKLEKASIEAFQKTFEGVAPGDDAGIYARLSQRHPFYNGKIYPVIQLNL